MATNKVTDEQHATLDTLLSEGWTLMSWEGANNSIDVDSPKGEQKFIRSDGMIRNR